MYRWPGEADQEVFDNLPQQLHRELKSEAYRPLLVVHPVFYLYAAAHWDGMKRVIVGACRTYMVADAEVVADPLEGAIFVANGSLEYRYGDRHVAHLIAKHWCCEETLWCRYPRLDGDLGAASGSHCQFVLLSAARFQNIASSEGPFLHILRGYASKFVSAFNDAADCAESLDSDALFNDVFIISGLLLSLLDATQLEKRHSASSFGSFGDGSVSLGSAVHEFVASM